MASSSLALRGLLSSTVVPRSIRGVRPAAASRLFTINTVRSYEDGDDGVEGRSNRLLSRRGGDFFSDELVDSTDMFDPWSLNQVLNFIEQFNESPPPSNLQVFYLLELREDDIHHETISDFFSIAKINLPNFASSLRLELMKLHKNPGSLGLEHFGL